MLHNMRRIGTEEKGTVLSGGAEAFRGEMERYYLCIREWPGLWRSSWMAR